MENRPFAVIGINTQRQKKNIRFETGFMARKLPSLCFSQEKPYLKGEKHRKTVMLLRRLFWVATGER
jgi:hypothetical protein